MFFCDCLHSNWGDWDGRVSGLAFLPAERRGRALRRERSVRRRRADVGPLARIERFGWNVINAPSNRVWIPRVKHRLITDWYNSTDPDDTRGRRRREVVSEMDYDAQYQDALATLRMFGVLQ